MDLNKHLQTLHEVTIEAIKSQEAKGEDDLAKTLLLSFLMYRQGMLGLQKHLEEFEKVWRR